MQLERVHLDFTGSARDEMVLTSSGTADGVRWDIDSAEKRFTLKLHADRETELHYVTARFTFPFAGRDRIFVNGYQSWTDSREYAVSALPDRKNREPAERTTFVRRRLHSLDRLPKALVNKYAFDRYGDYDFVAYGRKRGQLHAFSYAYVRRGGEFTLLGSLAEESGFTVIRFDTRDNSVTLEKDCRGRRFTGDYTAFDMAFLTGGENEVFDLYFAMLGVPAPRFGRIFGYTSWYNRYENITENSVAEDLKGFAAAEPKPDVFQIDDGYELSVGDWLMHDPAKFPSGMAAAAEKIRAAGMTPGLWLAPFAAEKKSALVKNHPDWLLTDDRGEPVVGGSNWSGFYALDIYNEEVRAYLREVFDTVISRWGFRFVKLDFLYAACIRPRPGKTRGEIMFDGMRLLRELCGDAVILGCGVPLAPAFGLVDYCRIGCDVSLSWDDRLYMRAMHRERVSTKNTILNTVFRRQLNGRAFMNDPDVFLLRKDNTRLTGRQKRILATVNALFGGVLFTSDDIAAYDRKTREVFEQTLSLSPGDFVEAELAGGSARVVYRKNGKKEKLYIPL